MVREDPAGVKHSLWSSPFLTGNVRCAPETVGLGSNPTCIKTHYVYGFSWNM